MNKKLFFNLGITLLLIGVLAVGFVSCSRSSDDDVIVGSSATIPSLRLTGLDLGKVVSFTKDFSGDPGSTMDSFQVILNKVELYTAITSVTVYSGGGYLETVGTADEIAGVLAGDMPPIGTYTGMTITVGGFKIKVKIVSDVATTYYTTDQTIGYASGISWTLSTSSAAYDHITITSTGFTMTTEFPTPMTVTGTSDVNLIWASERNGIITCDGDLPDDVTWAEEEEVIRATLPGMPSKQIQFFMIASSLSNTITFLLDGNGNLLGGFCHRPVNKAINGDILKSGSLSNVSNNGNAATFDVSFWDGMGTGYYQVTGDYDCGIGTYSSLTVTGRDGATPKFETDGFPLDTTGPVTSK